MSRRCQRSRKAAWLRFFAVGLASLSVTQATNEPTQALSISSSSNTPPESTPELSSVAPADTSGNKITAAPDYQQSNEAARAYKHAIHALSTITPIPSPARAGNDVLQNSFLSSLFPNQQGPIASAIRIIYKLRHVSWLPKFLNSGDRLGGMRRDEMRGRALKVVDLLEHAVELGNLDALYKLAEISMFPPNPLLRNITRAYHSYSQHAYLTGNATSQSLLAFFYSTGYDNVVEVDQAKALLYYTFAANGGSQGAQMALAYRFWAGIGVNDDCQQSLEWYQTAAEHAMSQFISGPPGGRTLPLTATKLSDLDGGAYGPGASVASTGLMTHRAVIQAASAKQAGETWEDVLEYYMFNAERGEVNFAYRLGKFYYHGSIYAFPGGIASGAEGVGGIPRDYQRAKSYFLRIARQMWPRDPPAAGTAAKKDGKDDDKPASYAAPSAGYLGRMFLRGEGVNQDFGMAKMWFERGAEYGERESHNGLGIIYRDGLVDGKKDIKKALLHFGAAAGQELAEARVHLAKYHYQRGEIKLATTYLENAIRAGSPFEAYYYLAEVYAAQAQNPATAPNLMASSCAMAVSFYKLVAERGMAWEGDLMADAEMRWNWGTKEGKEDAMLRWWVVAERGSEFAQNNIAYVLDQDKSVLRLTRFAPHTPSNDTARLSLTYWTRSAAQRNVDSLVKVGDYYYHGLGVADMPAETRWEKAAAYYQSAADTQLSAMAMWNLGWMYENGIGVPKDFHLAKRHYDMALETNSEAYFPVMLSLIKLHIRSFWYTLMGGKDGLTLWSDESGRTRKDAAEELEGSDQGVETVTGQLPGEEYMDGDDDDQWYMGRSRDEYNKRIREANVRAAAGEEDPIQWARDQRAAESEREGDFGPEDYFDASLRGGRREDGGAGGTPESEFAETMLLVVLCLAVSLLIWLRGRWVERRRREDAERAHVDAPGGNGDERNGAFPPPGDPARDEWAVLR
ncbi:HCP-like protein [Rickenella mellea]|uniref:HCP-like protein n=1 Tax=Rickenella mellea TaxID=50990 RepID=A0A4Y7Q748_9AGAM|nr:HCP-like protein [Rickenella mellea]